MILRHRNRIGTAAAVVMIVGVLAACGGPVDVDERLQGTQYDQVPPRYGVSHDDPVQDLRHEVEWGWTLDNYEVLDDHTLRVYVPDDNCASYRFIVNETETEIGIGVYKGLLPGQSRACAGIATNTSMVVRTEDPIGTRTVTNMFARK